MVLTTAIVVKNIAARLFPNSIGYKLCDMSDKLISWSKIRNGVKPDFRAV